MHPHRRLILAAQLSVLLSDLVLPKDLRNIQVQTNGTVMMYCEMPNSYQTSPIIWLRRCLDPKTDSHLEFLVSLDTQKQTKYSSAMEKRQWKTQADRSWVTLNLTKLMPSDSCIYFCMIVGSPEVSFGMRTQLRVVDVLTTSVQTTTTSTPKKKVCRIPRPVTRKGLPCNSIILILLVIGVLSLLLGLVVAIRCHRRQRRAQLQFMKQFYK